MSLTRREFLKIAGVTATVAVAPGLVTASDKTSLSRRAIPSSGEELPVVGLGTWQTFSLSRRESSAKVLARFVQLGGQLIDTSPMYGEAEQAIGLISEDLGVQERLFFATKVWTRGRKAGVSQIHRSAKLMQTSSIDLVQIHNLVDWQTHLLTLRQMKEDGLIRYIGITHYTTGAHDELARIIESESLDFVQVNYNIATRNAEHRLLPLAADKGVAVIINRPYAEGSLFRQIRNRELPEWADDFDCESFGQIFLKFILSHPAVTVVIPATSKVHHLEDNLGAATGRLPDESERRRMITWFDSI